MSTLADIMTKQIVAVCHTTAVKDAAAKMRDKRVGSLLIEKDNEYVGIVTETDVIRKAAAEGLDLSKTKVSKIMSHPILSMESIRSIRDANDMMADRKIRHLAVTEAGKVVGVLSVRDLVVSFQSYSEPNIGYD